MRLSHLTLTNFKKFKSLSLPLHPQFSLFVGDNGSGKTTILDAAAVALGIWLVEPPDLSLRNSDRRLEDSDIYGEYRFEGDRHRFFPAIEGVSIGAKGSIGEVNEVSWKRQIRLGRKRSSNSDAKDALSIIAQLYRQANAGQPVVLPIIAYYGAGRAWLPSRTSWGRSYREGNGVSRWNVFFDCLSQRIRINNLNEWFQSEAIAIGANGGKARPGYAAVKWAVLQCIPGATDLFFDPDRREVVLKIREVAQPLSNLSAGQVMMLAMVADIAIKAVQQNSFLIGSGVAVEGEVPRVLRETPGVILIDELDVHLHPSWQRAVFGTLLATFPALQFVCTSHSPQIIGEIPRGHVFLLDKEGIHHPSLAFGTDSNWILENVMAPALSRNTVAGELLRNAEDALLNSQLGEARQSLAQLRKLLGGPDRETSRLEGALTSLELLADDENN